MVPLCEAKTRDVPDVRLAVWLGVQCRLSLRLEILGALITFGAALFAVLGKQNGIDPGEDGHEKAHSCAWMQHFVHTVLESNTGLPVHSAGGPVHHLLVASYGVHELGRAHEHPARGTNELRYERNTALKSLASAVMSLKVVARRFCAWRCLSVERILYYTNVEQEAPWVIEARRPPLLWPKQPTIIMVRSPRAGVANVAGTELIFRCHCAFVSCGRSSTSPCATARDCRRC